MGVSVKDYEAVMSGWFASEGLFVPLPAPIPQGMGHPAGGHGQPYGVRPAGTPVANLQATLTGRAGAL
jgi:hypothetical protein